MPDKKPVARPRRAAPKRVRLARADLTPLEFMKRVYRAPVPRAATITERIRIVANQLNAARHAAAIEIRLGQAETEGDLAALLRELEGSVDEDH
jgi:hypothetical protein